MALNDKITLVKALWDSIQNDREFRKYEGIEEMDELNDDISFALAMIPIYMKEINAVAA